MLIIAVAIDHQAVIPVRWDIDAVFGSLQLAELGLGMAADRHCGQKGQDCEKFLNHRAGIASSIRMILITTSQEDTIPKQGDLFRIFDKQGAKSRPTIASQQQQCGRHNESIELCIDKNHSPPTES